MSNPAPFLAPMVLAILLGSSMVTGPAGATYVINPEGTGDFPNIQAAINDASDGDVIELTNGTFTGAGNTDVDYLGKAVTVTSQYGAGSTSIQCAGGRAFLFQTGEGSASFLLGVTIRQGQADEGGAVYISGAGPTIDGCRFEDCSAAVNAGAIRILRGEPIIHGCEFIACAAVERGGAIYTGPDAHPEIDACVFDGCEAALRGGALYVSTSPATVTDCLFQYNRSSLGGAVALNNYNATFTRCTFYRNDTNSRGGGGAIWACDLLGNPILENCTLYGNQASADNGAIYLNGGATATLENTLIAFNTSLAIYCADAATASLACCDLYGNTSGDWVGVIAPQQGIDGNIHEDPLFCDPTSPGLEIECGSPCVAFTPPNPECDLIGAWGVGCGASPVEALSWGALKARFR
jgi:hypothetical protein